MRDDRPPSLHIQYLDLAREATDSMLSAFRTNMIKLTMFPPEILSYPMVWCGAIVPLMHRHQYTQYDETRTRSWHETDGSSMKKISCSHFVPNRVIAGLSGCFMKISTNDYQAMGYLFRTSRILDLEDLQ